MSAVLDEGHNLSLRQIAAMLRADIKARALPSSSSGAKVSVRVVPWKDAYAEGERIAVTITAWSGGVFRDEFVEWVMDGEHLSTQHRIPGIWQGHHGSDVLVGAVPSEIGAIISPIQLNRYDMECFDELAVCHPALIKARDELNDRVFFHTNAVTGTIVVDLFPLKRDALRGLRDERDGTSKEAAQQAKDTRKASHPHVRVKLERRTAHGEEMIEFRRDASPRLADIIAAADDINRAIADATYAGMRTIEPKRSEATVQVVYGRWVVIVSVHCESGAAAALGVTR